MVYHLGSLLSKPGANVGVMTDLLQGMLGLAAQFASATSVSYLGALFTAVQSLLSGPGKCDGVVVADVIRFTPTMLASLASNKFQTTVIYHGENSPAIWCGSNSVYILAIYATQISAVTTPAPVSTLF